MKALDKYIIAEFLAPLGLVVLGVAGLVEMAEVVDKLPSLRAWGASGELIFLFHLTRFPYIITQVIPIGVMMASLISLGSLARSSELTAARAGGISTARIALPILMAALGISLLLFGISEALVPASSDYSRYIQKVLIEKRDVSFDNSTRVNMAKTISDDRQLFARNYDSGKGVMQEVIIIRRKDQRISDRIDAHKMSFDPKSGWMLFNGVERVFDASGDEKALRTFKQWPASVSESPRDFMVDSDKKEEDLLQLSIHELWDIISVLKKTGADYRKELICLYIRVSYPFSCFILALLGVSLPFLFPSGRRAMAGAALGVLVSLGCGMLYLVFIQVGLSLGKSGYLPMLLSAWIGNIVFLMIGSMTLWKINR